MFLFRISKLESENLALKIQPKNSARRKSKASDRSSAATTSSLMTMMTTKWYTSDLPNDEDLTTVTMYNDRSKKSRNHRHPGNMDEHDDDDDEFSDSDVEMDTLHEVEETSQARELGQGAPSLADFSSKTIHERSMPPMPAAPGLLSDLTNISTMSVANVHANTTTIMTFAESKNKVTFLIKESLSLKKRIFLTKFIILF